MDLALSFGCFPSIVFAIVAVLWLHEMAGRWRSDLEEFRTTADRSAKLVIAALWLVTAFIALTCADFVVGLFGVLWEAFA